MFFMHRKLNISIDGSTSAKNNIHTKESTCDLDATKQILHACGIDLYDPRLTWRVLFDAGITQKDIRQFIFKYAAEQNGNRAEPRHLIEIISKYILDFDGGFNYGNKTEINTEYYICSVEASRDPEYLNWMVSLLCKLISKAEKEGVIRSPNFILTPKGGNIFLGNAVAERFGIPFVTSKYSLVGSHVDIITNDETYDIKTNYEGSWKLFERTGLLEPGQKLYGIVVDDTTATGEQIVDAITDFNKKAGKAALQVYDIGHAFTLFCAVDDDKCKIDELFEENRITLHRYFDLSEKAKQAIVTARGDQRKLSVYSAEDRAQIDELLAKLKDSIPTSQRANYSMESEVS